MRGKVMEDIIQEIMQEEIIQSEKGPKCPFCGTVSTYLEDVDWFFNYKTCGHCGRNYVARKTAENPMFESKSTMNHRRKGQYSIW